MYKACWRNSSVSLHLDSLNPWLMSDSRLSYVGASLNNKAKFYFESSFGSSYDLEQRSPWFSLVPSSKDLTRDLSRAGSQLYSV